MRHRGTSARRPGKFDNGLCLTLVDILFLMFLLFCFFCQAKYLRHRRIIVDWMCEVGEEYKLAALTTHNAVRYLDRVLGATDVPKNRLQLVAMACVLVASKVEEAEEVTPTLAELNECSNHAYSTEALKEMEVAVLRALGWALTVVNPIHFLHFFQARGIVFQGDVSCNHTRASQAGKTRAQN